MAKPHVVRTERSIHLYGRVQHNNNLPEGIVELLIPVEERQIETLHSLLAELQDNFGFSEMECEQIAIDLHEKVGDKAILANMKAASREWREHGRQ